MFEDSTILITGGTGSFGNAFLPMTLKKYNPKKIIIYSRDEMKQWEMAKLFQNDDRVRFFIGDVRDRLRFKRALDGVDYVVHAAAMKIVPKSEYDPFECIKTNINGAMNLIDICIDRKVKKIVADHLGIEEEKVTEEASFIDDLGADSLDTVELVMAFEEEFGSEISDSEAEKILTVGDAIKFIEGKSSQ